MKVFSLLWIVLFYHFTNSKFANIYIHEAETPYWRGGGGTKGVDGKEEQGRGEEICGNGIGPNNDCINTGGIGGRGGGGGGSENQLDGKISYNHICCQISFF